MISGTVAAVLWFLVYCFACWVKNFSRQHFEIFIFPRKYGLTAPADSPFLGKIRKYSMTNSLSAEFAQRMLKASVWISGWRTNYGNEQRGYPRELIVV